MYICFSDYQFSNRLYTPCLIVIILVNNDAQTVLEAFSFYEVSNLKHLARSLQLNMFTLTTPAESDTRAIPVLTVTGYCVIVSFTTLNSPVLYVITVS